jgi:hypothetical protein
MTTTNVTTPSMSTTLTVMVVGFRKTGKRILDHPCKKGARGPSITYQTNTIKEEACRAEATVMVEAHLSLRTACTTTMTPTIAQKSAQFSLNPREKWSKNPTSLRNNPHQRSESHNAMGTASHGPRGTILKWKRFVTQSS